MTDNKGLIKYSKNTSWMMGEKFVQIWANLFVGIWIARYLGPDSFGLLSYVLAFVSIFSGVAKLGLDGIVIRDLVSQEKMSDFYMATAFWLKLGGAMLAIMLILFILPFTSNDNVTNCYVLIVAIGTVFQSFEVVQFYFQSKVFVKYVSICKMIQLIISSIVKIILVLTDAELILFVFVTLIDAILLAIFYLIAYSSSKKKFPLLFFNFKLASKMLRDSWPLMFSAIVVLIYMRIDQIMIKEMIGQYDVGLYSAAVKLSEAFYFIPLIITASLFPAIINARKKGQNIYKDRLTVLYTFLAWIAIILALPVSIFSESLITVFFGENYKNAAGALRVHIWSGIFVFIGVAYGKSLIAENLTKIEFYRTALGAFLNVLLNLWLIPIYGMLGAAYGTLFAQLIANLLYDIFDKRLHFYLKIKYQAMFMPWVALSLAIRMNQKIKRKIIE